MFFLDYTPELNETDILIYKFFAANITDVKRITIREVAEETHTSTASVLRFCKKFDCSGFSEFKIKLRNYAEKNEQKILRRPDATELISFLSRTQDPYYETKIQEAVDLLKEKELVIFLGVGSSNIVAEYGALYFSSLFNMAIRIEDPSNHPINYLSSTLAKKICVIALSVSGETGEITNYLNHLNLTDSSVISITNSSKSTIAQLADVNIPYYVSVENLNGADITSQIPAMYIIETIAKEVRNQKDS